MEVVVAAAELPEPRHLPSVVAVEVAVKAQLTPLYLLL
jgi:hypothetical protein